MLTMNVNELSNITEKTDENSIKLHKELKSSVQQSTLMSNELLETADTYLRRINFLEQQNRELNQQLNLSREEVKKLNNDLMAKELKITESVAREKEIAQQKRQSDARIEDLERNADEIKADLEAKNAALEKDAEGREENFRKMENELKV